MASQPSLQEFAAWGDKEGTYDNNSGQWCYWRKPGSTDKYGKTTHEMIVAKPCWPVEFMRQVRKGFTPLMEQYGTFHPDVIKYMGQRWTFHQDPYRLILLKGGAKEFSLAQILELGWHRKPPIKGLVFEQLEGTSHQDVVCSTCSKRYLNIDDLHAHEQIAHKELSSNQELGRQIASATTGVMSGPLADAIKMLAQAMEGIQKQQAELESRVQAALETSPSPRRGRQTPE